MHNKIELTREELKEIEKEAADEGIFRHTVLKFIKENKKIPNRVNRLEIHSKIHWVLISFIIAGIVGTAITVIAKINGR